MRTKKAMWSSNLTWSYWVFVSSSCPRVWGNPNGSGWPSGCSLSMTLSHISHVWLEGLKKHQNVSTVTRKAEVLEGLMCSAGEGKFTMIPGCLGRKRIFSGKRETENSFYNMRELDFFSLRKYTAGLTFRRAKEPQKFTHGCCYYYYYHYYNYFAVLDPSRVEYMLRQEFYSLQPHS